MDGGEEASNSLYCSCASFSVSMSDLKLNSSIHQVALNKNNCKYVRYWK